MIRNTSLKTVLLFFVTSSPFYRYVVTNGNSTIPSNDSLRSCKSQIYALVPFKVIKQLQERSKIVYRLRNFPLSCFAMFVHREEVYKWFMRQDWISLQHLKEKTKRTYRTNNMHIHHENSLSSSLEKVNCLYNEYNFSTCSKLKQM